jgi:hypothetical protein
MIVTKGKDMAIIIRTEKVYNLMLEEGIETDMASPNFVADFAYSRGIYLTSREVVAISDAYENEEKMLDTTSKNL